MITDAKAATSGFPVHVKWTQKRRSYFTDVETVDDATEQNDQ